MFDCVIAPNHKFPICVPTVTSWVNVRVGGDAIGEGSLHMELVCHFSLAGARHGLGVDT